MRLTGWIVVMIVLLHIALAVTYFFQAPLASTCLAVSMILVIIGFWLTEYEAKMMSVGEPIPAHRLPFGIYRVKNCLRFPNGEIAVFVVFPEGRVKYCYISYYKISERYPITQQEIETDKMDWFEVARNPNSRGKQIFLMRFNKLETE